MPSTIPSRACEVYTDSFVGLRELHLAHDKTIRVGHADDKFLYQASKFHGERSTQWASTTTQPLAWPELEILFKTIIAENAAKVANMAAPGATPAQAFTTASSLLTQTNSRFAPPSATPAPSRQPTSSGGGHTGKRGSAASRSTGFAPAAGVQAPVLSLSGRSTAQGSAIPGPVIPRSSASVASVALSVASGNHLSSGDPRTPSVARPVSGLLGSRVVPARGPPSPSVAGSASGAVAEDPFAQYDRCMPDGCRGLRGEISQFSDVVWASPMRRPHRLCPSGVD